jgi:hypothetical protein
MGTAPHQVSYDHQTPRGYLACVTLPEVRPALRVTSGPKGFMLSQHVARSIPP